MKKTCLLLAAMMIVGICAASALSAADLDGTAWRISEKGKKETEDLIFVNGQFTSSGCVPYGFLTSSYSSTKQDDVIKWSALQSNSDNEKMVWNGQASGTTIKGKFLYTNRYGKTTTSDWSGKKLEAK